jgi:shikimate 5-dehydrogenase
MRLAKFFNLKNWPVYGDESIVEKYSRNVNVILNVSLKGQHGDLENFSALAPTDNRNHETSMKIAEDIPKETVFADIIYNPEESIFLKHGRETGHKTLNGYGMLLNQAVKSFEILYKDEFKKSGLSNADIAKIMKSNM